MKVETLLDCDLVELWLFDKIDFFLAGKAIDENVIAPQTCHLIGIIHV